MRSLGRLRIPLVILAVVLSVSVVSSAGSLSFTADRQAGLDVVDDADGIVSLDKTGEIRKGSNDALLTEVTNPTGNSVELEVRISGTDWSFSPGPEQTVTTTSSDETLRTTVDGSSTVEIRVNVTNNAAKGDRPYDMTVQSPDFDWEKTPTVDIVAGQGPPDGKGPGSGDNPACEKSGGNAAGCS
ncbi:hypothetical protein N0B31_07220 [Salinirubellus salinus]|uniref:Uncharacterized protein n=1 Tax=Salinirubellus salinus TaxID=1364945 RepID=A0A9E7UCP3_9EURY|nr:hypothetical protein [Salinirubellus salinus]UWM56074.1 hypothetical protein N0B31_07220 [Salinirubellus salinus]